MIHMTGSPGKGSYACTIYIARLKCRLWDLSAGILKWEKASPSIWLKPRHHHSSNQYVDTMVFITCQRGEHVEPVRAVGYVLLWRAGLAPPHWMNPESLAWSTALNESLNCICAIRPVRTYPNAPGPLSGGARSAFNGPQLL